MNKLPEEYQNTDTGVERPVTGQGGMAAYGRKVFSSFRNPIYRKYYYSLIGHWAPMQMQVFVRSYLVKRITGSGSKMGWMSLAHSLPMLFISLWGGALADRLEKRQILIISQVASAVITLAVGLTITFNIVGNHNPDSWWILLGSGLAQGIVMGVMMPSRASMVPEIVEPRDLMNAISLNNMGMNVFRILAPSATGLIVDNWGFAAVYYIMTALYLYSNIFLFAIPKKRPTVRQGSSTATEVAEGLNYMKKEKTIMLILVFTLFCTILGMPFMMMLPMFEDVLEVGASSMGLLMAVSGVGSIIVSVVLASLSNKRRGILMLYSGLILSIALVIFSFNTNWYLALVISIFIGLGQTGQTAIGFTLIQYYVDPGFRGRVMSFMMLGFGLSSLGTVFAGLLTDSVGIQWAIGSLAMLLTLTTIVMMIFSTQLRKLD